MRRIALTLCLSMLVHHSIAAMPHATNVHVQGEVISVKAAPGCGVVFFGSPVIYRVISGDSGWVGKQVTVVVPCLEMAQMSGTIPRFSVGDRQDLVLTKTNVHKIESPSAIPAQWFYLRSASRAK